LDIFSPSTVTNLGKYPGARQSKDAAKSIPAIEQRESEEYLYPPNDKQKAKK
jgi:hypothetical protein